MTVLIRVAQVSDADDIVRLTRQLGYEVIASTVAARVSRILSRSDQQLLVAELSGHPVGWLHAAVAEYLEAEPFVVIGGLVVESNHRREGIGTALVARAEEWAHQQGCSIVRLWSSTGRTGSHRFYEQLGYINVKTQYSFVKALDGAGNDTLQRFVPKLDQ